MIEIIIAVVISLLIGGGVGFFTKKVDLDKKIKDADEESNRVIDKAKTKAREALISAKDEVLRMREEAKKEERRRLDKISKLEQRIATREENFDKKLEEIEKRKDKILKVEDEQKKIQEELDQSKAKYLEELQKIAQLTKDEAKEILIKKTEKECEQDILRTIKEMKQKAKDEGEREAKEIIATIIQRLASEHTAEHTIKAIPLPSDEVKGRIIGREGRNIQAFERITGVDVIVDDTPESVTVSCFDPVRRHVAMVSLEKLIADGRIHPAQIEKVVKQAADDIKSEIKEAGEDAAYKAGAASLPIEIIKILGRLKFRTSYGQNQLQHAIEVSKIATLLAAELGADVEVCRKAGLLHDLGKALDHEIDQPHHHLTYDLLLKFGMPEKVAHAAAAHHDDLEAKTIEALVVKTADAISGARPGARRESTEQYIQRLKELENISSSFEGVEKTYAIQAGREIRIFVKPEEISDLKAERLSKDIARKIEQELTYPGQIKVHVIRETRAVDFAK
ncbi:ribonuclease Y [Patescibacteria group bacterium]|nr:ribonuclease Y [Patescibacteria group bacterium]